MKFHGSHKLGQVGSRNGDGYLYINLSQKMYRLHRLSFVYMGIDPTGFQVDHKDGVRNNNKWGNLRLATKLENCLNKECHRNGKEPYIEYRKRVGHDRWEILRKKGIPDGRQITTYYGSFDSLEKAIKRRDELIENGWKDEE